MSAELAEADFGTWAARLRGGERRALARLLTIAESTRPEHGHTLGQFLQFVGCPDKTALRLGVTGIPGAGKSTLIDALGSELLQRGSSVAVLAVDPSSVLSGGSVLGDKVRMTRLGSSDRAFIRPVPSGGVLGGVTVHLDQCARLCELAGYDRILLETVGVGQSEVDVALVCDLVSVVAVPGTGDELQTVKRGIMEFADVLVLNKTDQLPEAQVRALVAMYEEGLSLVQGRNAAVVACSGHTGQGITQWADQLELQARLSHVQRGHRRTVLFRRLVEHALLRKFWDQENNASSFREITTLLLTERLTLRQAVERALTAASW